jgi:enoyl-CoA hydratase
MLAALRRALDEIEEDDEVRVVVLRGEGRAFCVGRDLGPSSPSVGGQPSAWESRTRIRSSAETYLKVWDFPKPVIAQVHGYCLAAGVQLALCADLTVISEDCKIGWPKLPMGGGFISPMFAWLVGPKRAKEMSFIAGSEISGREAAEWGFANRAVPAEELDATVSELARRAALLPGSLLELKKSAINRVYDSMGFRESVLAGVEWDVISHKDPHLETVRGWLREMPMKDAIARFEADGL